MSNYVQRICDGRSKLQEGTSARGLLKEMISFKKLVAYILVIGLLLQLSACGSIKETAESVASTAKETADSAKETMESAKESVASWYSNIDFSRFRDGWDNAVEYMGARYSAALSSEYVRSVSEKIAELKVNINESAGSARDIAQEAGFVAEKWAEGTFNIDATAAGSSETAQVVGSNDLGSVDVSTSYGQKASLKYYKDAQGSAAAQAKTIIEAYKEYSSKSKEPVSLKEYLDVHGYDSKTQAALLKSVYEGQERIIPANQIDDAVAYLQGRIDKIAPIEGDVSSARVESYKETMSRLKDRLQSPSGVESQPLSNQELQAITELAQKGEFKPEDFGVSLSDVIKPKYILKQAVGTGLSTGAIKAAIEVGPDVYSIFSSAMENGEVPETEIEKVGIEGALSFSEGFIEGSVSRSVTTLCQEGIFGEALRELSPGIIAMLTVLVIEAAISGYELAEGKITAEDYGNLMADHIMISILAMPSTAVMLSVLPATKLAMLIGCLGGAMLASVGYVVGKEVLLDIIDGGGFEAIVPKKTATTLSVAREKIEAIHLEEHISSLKDSVVSIAEGGYIRVKMLTER